MYTKTGKVKTKSQRNKEGVESTTITTLTLPVKDLDQNTKGQIKYVYSLKRSRNNGFPYILK